MIVIRYSENNPLNRPSRRQTVQIFLNILDHTTLHVWIVYESVKGKTCELVRIPINIKRGIKNTSYGFKSPKDPSSVFRKDKDKERKQK